MNVQKRFKSFLLPGLTGRYLARVAAVALLAWSFFSFVCIPIHIEGGTTVKISSGSIVKLDMERGKIFGLLDDVINNRQFEVSTPHSVSAARGSYFQVRADASRTTSAVYKGGAKMAVRDVYGKAKGGAVSLNGAMSSLIDDSVGVPAEPFLMTQDSFDEINRIIRTFRKKRPILSYDETLKALARQGHNIEELMASRRGSGSARQGSKMVGSGDTVRDIQEGTSNLEYKKSKKGRIVF